MNATSPGYAAGRGARRRRRVDITVRLGPAFTLPPLPKEDREAALKRYTDEIMVRVWDEGAVS